MIRSCAPRGNWTGGPGKQAPMVSRCRLRVIKDINGGHNRHSARARSAARLAVSASSIPTRYSATDTEAMASSSSSSDERSMFRVLRRSARWYRGSGVGPRVAYLRIDQGDGFVISRPNSSPGGGTSASAARRSAPVRRWAGPISATGWPPRTMVIVSPRSTASSRSEKCRDASVAVMGFMRPIRSEIRFATRPARRRWPPAGAGDRGARPGKFARHIPRLTMREQIIIRISLRDTRPYAAFPRALQRSLSRPSKQRVAGSNLPGAPARPGRNANLGKCGGAIVSCDSNFPRCTSDLLRGNLDRQTSAGRESRGLPVWLAAEWQPVTSRFACQGAWGPPSLQVPRSCTERVGQEAVGLAEVSFLAEAPAPVETHARIGKKESSMS